MASFVTHSLLLLLAAAAPAQAETVWSSVSFLLYGERTPLRGSTHPELTPLGAQQMYSQGSLFRARYLEANSSFSQNRVTTYAPINNTELNALDNTQVSALSTDDTYIATSALAFLQGLYPPQTTSYAYGNGGRDAAVLANTTVVEFPLSGYQYPMVQTVSVLDMTSPWIEGNLACISYQQSALSISSDETVKHVYNSTRNFYQTLWSSVFQGTFTRAMTNFYYAYDLYDYASYQYKHNPQVANALNASTLSVLRTLAATQQRDMNANLSVSGLENGDMIRAVSGRMLASKIVSLLKQNIASNGSNNKLNLMFGSFEPFIAFFALSGLSSGPNSSNFVDLPDPGAAMVFELYSTSNDNSSYPSADDMYVRFLYRPNTDSGTPLTQYGLFATESTVTNMTFNAFSSAMGGIGINSVSKWCSLCDSVNLFCTALLGNSGSGRGSSGSSSGTSGNSSQRNSLSPAVAGVVGAVVTLAATGLLGIAAVILGGVRLHRAGSVNGKAGFDDETGKDVGGPPTVSWGSAGGGFKGPEKKSADADVVVSKSGARHERVGSWELHDSGNSETPRGQSASVGAVLHKDPVKSTLQNTDDEDDLADIHATPVQPREHI